MENVPYLLDASFILITLLTVGLFYVASRRSAKVLLAIGAWMLVQLGVSLTGFYQLTQTVPPRFVLLLAVPLIVMIILFSTRRGREFIDGLDPRTLTLLHTIRIGVELILYFLFAARAIPEIMTFEGRNLDILAGLTAPVVYYYYFVNKVLPDASLRLWNLIGLGLLANIVVTATLSVATPFQQFGFDQPNQAILHFPYVWLPSVVVPIVLFSHFVAVRRLNRSTESTPV